jgi:DNA-binding CsgD family transcriptional regulator
MAPPSYFAANRRIEHYAVPNAALNTAHGNESLGERLTDAVADCVPATGREEFTDIFLEIVRVMGAGQVAAFAYRPEEVSCLLTRNFLAEDKGGTLAATYLDGWFREDPLFERVIAMTDNDCTVERLEDLLPRISSRYLTMFFGTPGFRTKIAVVVAQDSFKMVLNLYFEGDIADHSSQMPDGVGDATYRLIGKTLATHFLRLKPPEFPLPLTVLSERERQVCIGMLSGKKAEIIAEEIGIGQSSVVTYRQRAYQKLGISSRGQLFSICRSEYSGLSKALPG